MNYKSFDTAITAKYGVVCDNWPLETFCCPGEINGRTELEVLYQAWKNGVAQFRKLTAAELSEWKHKTFLSKGPGHTTVVGTTPEVAPSQPGSPSAAVSSLTSLAAPDSLAHPIKPTDAQHTSIEVDAPIPSVAQPSGSSLGIDPARPVLTNNTAHQNVSATTGEKRTYSETFTFADGALVLKKPRAPRRDKGIPRGPNARTAGKKA